VAESAGGITRPEDRTPSAGPAVLPTAAHHGPAATPGVRIRLLDMAEIVPKLSDKFGPVYFKGLIPKGTYSGVDYDVTTAAMVVSIFCHEKMEEDLAYQITKIIIEKKSELVLFIRKPNISACRTPRSVLRFLTTQEPFAISKKKG